ncbi:MAG: hypothetical protein LAO76_10415 [Acidobacteriia bacterium]|nr:hypothetical protein [Terriglobia bacterium]
MLEENQAVFRCLVENRGKDRGKPEHYLLPQKTKIRRLSLGGEDQAGE